MVFVRSLGGAWNQVAHYGPWEAVAVLWTTRANRLLPLLPAGCEL